jgi:hypothetical protein
MSIFPLKLLIFWAVYFILAVGRFHDIGSSGWWAFSFWWPVINLIVWAYLLLAPSAVRKEGLLLNHLPHPSTAHAAQKYSRRCRHSAARVLGFLQA